MDQQETPNSTEASSTTEAVWETLTAALLDCLTHYAHIVELLGESYRFCQCMQGDKSDEPG